MTPCFGSSVLLITWIVVIRVYTVERSRSEPETLLEPIKYLSHIILLLITAQKLSLQAQRHMHNHQRDK